MSVGKSIEIISVELMAKPTVMERCPPSPRTNSAEQMKCRFLECDLARSVVLVKEVEAFVALELTVQTQSDFQSQVVQFLGICIWKICLVILSHRYCCFKLFAEQHTHTLSNTQTHPHTH